MKKIRRKSKVVRISYGRDIIFVVENIIKNRFGHEIAILKGITERIEVDSDVDDLELVSQVDVEKNLRSFDSKIDKKIEEQKELFEQKNQSNFRKGEKVFNGKVLHLDGDKRYSEKSWKYYQKIGIPAVVKSIPESKQPKLVYGLLKYHKPDILVITRT